jgi:hypothetical protein
MTTPPNDLVPGRSCQGCTMCCKLMEVDTLAKPRGTWCPHCDQKRGCGIYAERPEACRIFYCGYLRIAHLDDRWKPAKAKFLINYESSHNRIVIHVDPARPDAWRAEPYYAEIRSWARNAAAAGGFVVVWTGQHALAVMASGEKDLGLVRDDQVFLRRRAGDGHGTGDEIIVVDAGDPRVAAVVDGSM